MRVAAQVVDLVEIERPRDQPLERARALAGDQRAELARKAAATDLLDAGAQLPDTQFCHAEGLVRGEAGFLERVRERIMADVVQKRGESHGEAIVLGDPVQLAALLERRQGAARQMIRAERMLEPGVGGAGIDEEGEADLADVAQALERRRVEREQRRPVQADVVPEGVADDLQVGWIAPDHTRGPCRRRSRGTLPRGTARNSP